VKERDCLLCMSFWQVHAGGKPREAERLAREQFMIQPLRQMDYLPFWGHSNADIHSDGQSVQIQADKQGRVKLAVRGGDQRVGSYE